MKVVYSAQYEVGLRDHPGHTSKYRRVLDRLQFEGLVAEADVIQAEMVADEDFLRVHTFPYWSKICEFDFSPEEMADAEIPLTVETVDSAWRTAGGTLQASEQALKDGVCMHLGGGHHHAFSDHATGFCIINDIAVGVRSLIERGLIKRAAVIDCDVHQGDGTARIFQNDLTVFTFSIHQKRNFPYFKQRSTVDVELEDGTSDAAYLDELEKGLDQIFSAGDGFDLVHYQAGADPYSLDRLGGLALSVEGLKERDRMVMERTSSLGIPVVITLGGGYAPDVEDVVEIHLNTARVALAAAKRWKRR